jgi:hypothetical protein
MSRELVAHNRPVFDHLHPRVYAGAVGLVAWFALSAWILFDRQPDISLLLGFVTVLFLMAVLIPLALAQVWRRHRPAKYPPQQAISFSDWRAGDFAVWGSRVRGTEAAINLLLPLAAVAFGLTGIGIVFLICSYFAS